MDLTQLLAFTMQNDASDLHLSAGSPPIIRSSGQLKRVKADPLSSEDIRTMLYSIMTEDQRAEYEKNMEIDFAIALGEKARFRVNGFTTRLGSCAEALGLASRTGLRSPQRSTSRPERTDAIWVIQL